MRRINDWLTRFCKNKSPNKVQNSVGSGTFLRVSRYVIRLSQQEFLKFSLFFVASQPADHTECLPTPLFLFCFCCCRFSFASYFSQPDFAFVTLRAK